MSLTRNPLPPSPESLQSLWWSKLAESIQPPSRSFQKTYRDDRAAFVADCFRFPPGENPTPYQFDIMEMLGQYRRVAAYGPHGIGKTALASWTVLHDVLTADDTKAITTASAWRQLTKFLWPEIHKWAARLRWDILGRPAFSPKELQVLSLNISPIVQAFAVASDNPAYIEGAHAQRILYVFDEAKAIRAATWDAAEGAFSGAGSETVNDAFALAISTPGAEEGRFYDICARKDGFEHWGVRHVTLEEAIAAKRVSSEWAASMKRQWGGSNPVFINRVLGEFASTADDVLIPLRWYERAVERWKAWDKAGRPGKIVRFGIDIGRSVDLTVIAPRYEVAGTGVAVGTLGKYGKQSTMQTVGVIRAALDAAPEAIADIDIIGVGAGVYDRLVELGYSTRLRPFNAGAKSVLKDRSGQLGFPNRRSAAWWGLREQLDPDGGDWLALPPDEDLKRDLTTPKWELTSDGKIKIESKDAIRERLGRSTDAGDAVMEALSGPENYGGLIA